MRLPGRAACLAVVSAATVCAIHFGGFEPDRAVAHAQGVVADALDGPRFDDAAISLTRWRELSGSYDGADISGGHVVLRWANESWYCIEGTSARHGLQHLLGPGGSRRAGPCP